MRVQPVIDRNVIPRAASESFSQLETATEQQIVVNVIVAGTVVEVDVPSVITTPAAVANNGCFCSVEKGKVWVFVDHFLRRTAVAMPETVSPP